MNKNFAKSFSKFFAKIELFYFAIRLQKGETDELNCWQ
jgi:hypothetical protein